MKPGKILKRSTEQRPLMIVVDKNGLEGTADHEAAPEAASRATPNASPDATSSTDAEARLLVRFENGEQVLVPRELLNRQQDGRYRLALSIEELMAQQDAADPSRRTDGRRDGRTGTDHHDLIAPSEDATEELPLVIPVTEERVRVQTRAFETGRVELQKTVHEHTEVVDQVVRTEEVEIERVPVNQLVEEPIPVRHEGDTTIVSLLEEVLVIEKRLVLREEVHIKKLCKEVHKPQEVRLREERVEVVRKPGAGQVPIEEETQEDV